MGRGEFITSVSGTILCMWFSLWLVERNVKGYGVLKSLGDASMDIYILSDPVQTVSRLALWNILHMPKMFWLLCYVLCQEQAYHLLQQSIFCADSKYFEFCCLENVST